MLPGASLLCSLQVGLTVVGMAALCCRLHAATLGADPGAILLANSLCCVQVGLTVVGVAAFALQFAGLTGPSAIILGGALAMSTTAVAIQVLEDRGEMGSR
jgi:hypothetical protein